jgi:hypothetical protein|tara:strand:- start:1909 stop:2235 length:327 start_codon:yes stop_codon:yes gene_type:complete
MTSKTLDIDTMIELGLFDKETDSEEPKFRDGPESRKAKTPKTLPKPKPKTPKTLQTLPKPKPKTPTETAAKKKKKSSGVTFDTSGTLKKSAMGRAVMKKRGGTFKGVF